LEFTPFIYFVKSIYLIGLYPFRYIVPLRYLCLQGTKRKCQTE